MVIIMEPDVTEAQVENVIEHLVNSGLNAHRTSERPYMVIGAVGDTTDLDVSEFEVMPGVKEAYRVSSPYRLANRVARPLGTVVKVGEVEIGGDYVQMIVGPPDVTSREEFDEIALAIASVGGRLIHGMACNVSYSPHNPKCSVEERSGWLRSAADRYGLKVVSDVNDTQELSFISEFSDMLHINSRNMNNYSLLRDVGRQDKPVVLDRALSATAEELLLSAEYVLMGGNAKVVLCECGIRTFDVGVPSTMDLVAIPVIKSLSHLPILANPSRATGRKDRVPSMGKAAIAAGADGLIIDVHPNPMSLSLGSAQSLSVSEFRDLLEQLKRVVSAVGRKM